MGKQAVFAQEKVKGKRKHFFLRRKTEAAVDVDLRSYINGQEGDGGKRLMCWFAVGWRWQRRLVVSCAAAKDECSVKAEMVSALC